MPDAKTPQKLDIQKYRSDELLTRLIDLVSIPNAIGSALRAGLVVLIAVLFVFSWLLWAETFLRPVWMIATAWSLLASAVTGSIFGLIYVLFNALKNT